MIRCRRCGCWLDHSTMCSDLAVLVLHWMTEHLDDWCRMHPGQSEYLR